MIEVAYPAAGLAEPPPTHRLHVAMNVPVGQLRDYCWSWLAKSLREPEAYSHKQREWAVTQLLDAAVHRYLLDSDGHRWTKVVDEFAHLFTESADGLAQILDGLLYRALRDSVGPLRPSLQYSFEFRQDWLVLTPTLPTIHDYEERIAAMADPDEGWVSRRHRQR